MSIHLPSRSVVLDKLRRFALPALVWFVAGSVCARAQATAGDASGAQTTPAAGADNQNPQDAQTPQVFAPPPMAVEYPDITDANMSEDRPLGSLSTLNESALTVYTDAQHHPAFGINAELSEGYTDNIYDVPSNKIAGSFGRFAFPATYERTTDQSQLHASYFPEILYYPVQGGGTFFTQSFGLDFIHKTSERTSIDWQVAGGRYKDLGQYLPTLLPIGGIGIAQASLTGSTLDNSITVDNAATSIALSHRLTERNLVTTTATFDWEEDYLTVPAGQFNQMLRSETAGLDVAYEHAISTHTTIGADGSVIYIRGLAPTGHLEYATVLATMRRQFTSKTSIGIGVGPLFSRASSAFVAPGSTPPTYAGYFNISHNSHFATMSAGYSRVIQLGYLQAAVVANNFSGDLSRPITPLLDLTFDARYIKSDSSSVELQQSALGASGRLDYHLGNRMVLFLNASAFRLSVPAAATFALPYNRNEVSGGLRFSLNAIASRQGR